MKSYLLIALSIVAANTLPAADQTLTWTDYTGRGFPADLVNYTVPAAGADKLSVLDSTGAVVPSQITPGEGADANSATLSFVADLPKDATRTYTIHTGGSSAAASGGVTTKTSDTSLEMSSSLLGVRVPPPTAKDFTAPVAASTLPAPIVSFCEAGGPWRGAGKILSDRKVKSFHVTLAAKGPVFAETRYEIEFADGGYYHASIRVIEGVPLAKIHEEYDAKGPVTQDYWELNATQGSTPDKVETMKAVGNGGYKENILTLADFIAKPAQTGGGGYGRPGSRKIG